MTVLTGVITCTPVQIGNVNLFTICGNEEFEKLVPDPGVRHQIYKLIAYGLEPKEVNDDIRHSY